MYKNVFLTGATGFVGSYILEELISKGYSVKALIRDRNKIKKHYDNCKYIVGDIVSLNTYEESLEGTEVIINLVGIIREFKSKGITFSKLHVTATENLLASAKKYNIKRFIQMSANGVAENSKIRYYQTKYKAEELVKNCAPNYTIFRPSIIFGPQDGFLTMLAKNIKKMPFFINIGNGNFPFQPISVKDVAIYFVESINNESTFNKTFCLCGNNIYTYKEIIMMLQKAMQLKRFVIPIPLLIIKAITLLLENVSLFPLTYDQLKMLLQGNICNDDSIDNIIHIKKITLEEEIEKIVKEV
jgi:NADH dehydrogenase